MRSPDTRLEETRAIKNLFDKFPTWEVWDKACLRNAAGGKGNNESHQESGLIFKVMDKNEP
jgi:hypothetical protein